MIQKEPKSVLHEWRKMQESRPRWADICDDSDDDESKRPDDERNISSVEMDIEGGGRVGVGRARKCRRHQSRSVQHPRRGEDDMYSFLDRHFCFCAKDVRVGVSGHRNVQMCIGASGRAKLANRLSGRHLEAGCPAPMSRRRTEFARRDICTMQAKKTRPSVFDNGRRRSVGWGWHVRMSAGAHVQGNACACSDPCMCAVPCSRTCMDELCAHTFSPCASAQAD